MVELTSGIDFEWEQQASPEHHLRITSSRVEVASIGGYEPGTGNEPLKRATSYRLRPPLAGGASITAVVKNAESAY